MPVLENSRWERFAQLAASGMATGEAYQQVYRGTARAARANGARLIANDRVSARVAELKTEAARDCRLSKKLLLDFCADVIQTPVGKVTPNSRLCIDYDPKSRRIRMPNKLDALDKIANIPPHTQAPMRVRGGCGARGAEANAAV